MATRPVPPSCDFRDVRFSGAGYRKARMGLLLNLKGSYFVKFAMPLT